jgi:hypothetical protein
MNLKTLIHLSNGGNSNPGKGIILSELQQIHPFSFLGIPGPVKFFLGKFYKTFYGHNLQMFVKS